MPIVTKFALCIGLMWIRGDDVVIKTGTRCRNKPSTAAILNLVFKEYLDSGLKYMH